MRVLRYNPGPPLDRLVECLWYLERYETGHKRERALPTGTVDLIFNLSGDWSVIAGAHEQYFVIDTSQPRAVAGVHFRPGGAAAFLGALAYELTGRQPACWRRQIRRRCSR